MQATLQMNLLFFRYCSFFTAKIYFVNLHRILVFLTWISQISSNCLPLNLTQVHHPKQPSLQSGTKLVRSCSHDTSVTHRDIEAHWSWGSIFLCVNMIPTWNVMPEQVIPVQIGTVRCTRSRFSLQFENSHWEIKGQAIACFSIKSVSR